MPDNDLQKLFAQLRKRKTQKAAGSGAFCNGERNPTAQNPAQRPLESTLPLWAILAVPRSGKPCRL
jgi:hypothetical protein